MIIGIASADYLRADHSETGEEAWGGSGWARLGQYVKPLQAAGHKVVCGTAWSEGEYFSVEDSEGIKTEPDVIILQRIMHDQVADTTKRARASGQFVLNDLDDWYWGLDPANEAFHASHPKINKIENTHFYANTLASSSLLTVSTPYLAERMQSRVRCPIVIVPNYVDVSRFTPVVQQELPTFGWAGSTSHRSGDIEVLRGIINQPLRDGLIKLHHSGAYEYSPSFADQAGLSVNQVSISPRSTYYDYPSLLTFDVGLIPLRDTPFNYAKSDIKGLEYAASGIPFISSYSPAYAKLYDDWGTGSTHPFFLCRKSKDWFRGIKTMLPYEHRLRYQAELLDLVQTRDIHYGIAHWIELLEGLTND